MYDDIKVEYKLPLPENPNGYKGATNFTTSSLENSYNVYKITADGKLLMRRVEGIYLVKDSLSDNLLERMPRFEMTSESYEHVKTFSGDVIFNTYQQCNDGNYDYSIEYTGKFVKGKLKKVEVTNFDCVPNENRKINDATWKLKLEKHNQFIQSKRYKYFLKYYYQSVKWLFRKIFKFINFIENNLRTLEIFIIK